MSPPASPPAASPTTGSSGGSSATSTFTATATPPTTLLVAFDPRVRQAFIDNCDFRPEDADLHFEAAPYDIPQLAVGRDGTPFMARHPIPKGQVTWFFIERAKPNRSCAVNPVCGNPQVPPGKLPIAPPDLEVPPPGREVPPSATPTSPTVSPTSPPATSTPRPPTATPVPPTATVPAKTATPKPPQTPAATLTPAPSGCPGQPACPGSGIKFPTVEPTVGQSNPQPEVTVVVPPQEVPTGAPQSPTEVVRP